MNVPVRPRLPEWLLFGFCALNAVPALLMAGDMRDPFASYDGNHGIRLIGIAAMVIDLVIVAAIAIWRIVDRKWIPPWLPGSLCVAGAALTWLELWYGSTFYYGEIRDKQGLPFGVNNLGFLGSYIFLGWLCWRLAPTIRARSLLLVGLLIAQIALYWIVREPWKLWQS